MGDEVIPGDVIGYVQESKLVRHQIMVPVDVKGRLSSIEEKKERLRMSLQGLRPLQAQKN